MEIYINLFLKQSKKGEWIYILNKKVRNCTKDLTKLLTVVAVASIIILAIMLVKYKTVYKVSISGQEVGYVLNKSEFEKLIEEKIIKAQSNIAYVDIEEPTYELMLTSSACDTNEQEIFDIINQSAVTTYKVY